jgi:hypothetical protein
VESIERMLNVFQQLDWRLIFSFVPITALIAAAVTLGNSITARRQARRALAIHLHEFYHSSDFYAKVRAPAYQVGLQWRHLPDTLRQAYREAVASGWEVEGPMTELSTYVPQIPQRIEGIIASHFHTAKGLPSLTEHQALAACLRFWSRLNTHLTLNTVNKKVIRALLADEFRSNQAFFRALSAAIIAKTPNTQQIPRWIHDIQALETFFGRHEQKTQPIVLPTRSDVGTPSHDITRLPTNHVAIR